MADLIDRQAALIALDEWEHTYTWDVYYKELEGVRSPSNAIEALPSAEPKRKTGRWIEATDRYGFESYYCSECEDTLYPRPIDPSWYFCPHCGAELERNGEDD